MIFGFLLAFAIPLLIYAAPHLGQKEFISILDLRLPFWLYLFQFALGLCLAVNLAKDFKDWFKKMISKQWLLTGVIPVAVVALLALIVCLAWIAPRHRVQSDESIFLATAQNLYANQVSGSCDEGEFSANGHLDCQKSVHNFKTKGEPFLYATLMPLFGQDLKWIFPLHIFLLIATIFLLFLAVYAWTSNSNLAFLTTALFAAQPTTLFQFRSASVEPLYTFLFALSVFLWKWAWDKNTIKHWVLLALVLAFFAQTRQETIFCLGAFVIISAFRIYPTLNAELKPFCTFLFELCVFLWELCVFLRKLIWNIKMFLNANPKLKKTNPIPRIPDFSQLSIFIRLFNSQFSIFLLTISIFCIPVLLTISYYQGYDFQGGEFSAHGHFFENLKQAWNLSVNTKPDNIGLLINPFLSSFSILTMLGILTLLGFSYYEWKNKSQKSDKGQPAYYILAFLLLYFPQIFMILENVSGDLTIEINQRYTLVAFPAMAFLCGFFIDKASLLLPQNNRLFFVFVAAGILWGNTLRYNDSFEKNIMYNRNHLTTEEAEILKWLRNEPKNNRLFVYSRPWHFIGYGINSIHYNSLNPQRLSELLKKYNGEVYYVRGLDCWDSQTYHKKAIEHRIATVCDR
ncbi:MAG: hypothetical protein FWF63_10260, partial [Fibromonadales bacterium]|nr:hypothetical protein [Fibromonadales bacterium]